MSTFKCDNCGGVFTKGWSDEAAANEAELNGFLNGEPTSVICDDCYEPFMKWCKERGLVP